MYFELYFIFYIIIMYFELVIFYILYYYYWENLTFFFLRDGRVSIDQSSKHSILCSVHAHSTTFSACIRVILPTRTNFINVHLQKHA